VCCAEALKSENAALWRRESPNLALKYLQYSNDCRREQAKYFVNRVIVARVVAFTSSLNLSMRASCQNAVDRRWARMKVAS